MKTKFKLVRKRGVRALNSRIRGAIQRPRRDGHILLMHNGRSGSTLLGDMLDQHQHIFWDGETIEKKLHRVEERKRVGIDKLYGHLDLDAGIEEVARRLQSLAGNRIFGTELQDYHLRMMETDFGSYVERLKKLGFSKFIFLERNYLRKVVSHLVATERRRFHIGTNRKASVNALKIDPERIYIGHRFTTLMEALREYRKFATTVKDILKDDDLLHLTYEEDLQSDPKVSVVKICDFLGLKLHDPTVNFGKTTDVPISEVIENFDEIKGLLLESEFKSEMQCLI